MASCDRHSPDYHCDGKLTTAPCFHENCVSFPISVCFLTGICCCRETRVAWACWGRDTGGLGCDSKREHHGEVDPDHEISRYRSLRFLLQPRVSLGG